MDNKTRQMTISQQNNQEIYSPMTEREKVKDEGSFVYTPMPIWKYERSIINMFQLQRVKG